MPQQTHCALANKWIKVKFLLTFLKEGSPTATGEKPDRKNNILADKSYVWIGEISGYDAHIYGTRNSSSTDKSYVLIGEISGYDAHTQ